MKDGIPVFGSGEFIHCHESVVNDTSKLLHNAEALGWDVALYNYTKGQVEKTGTVTEDQRMADWKYLFELNSKTTALVLGCGLGTIPIALSEVCGGVYAIDSSWEMVKFLNIRKKQQSIDNIYPICMVNGYGFPFPEKCFDLITMSGFRWDDKQPIRFREIVRRLHGHLKEGGKVHLSLGNRLSFQYLFRLADRRASISLHTIYGYRQILEAEGFSEIQFYAPLPHYDGIPLFYVPLEDNQSLNYFFFNIFPLFDMVSPEVKRAYRFQYAVAKAGVRLALLFRLTSLAKVFVPGFNIIAKKPARGLDVT